MVGPLVPCIVEHRAYLWELLSCLSLVSGSAELTNCITGYLTVVTVSEVTSDGLLDALLR